MSTREFVFEALFSTQQRKHKTWLDGQLRYRETNRKISVHDESGAEICAGWAARLPDEGAEIKVENATVQVGALLRQMKTAVKQKLTPKSTPRRISVQPTKRPDSTPLDAVISRTHKMFKPQPQPQSPQSPLVRRREQAGDVSAAAPPTIAPFVAEKEPEAPEKAPGEKAPEAPSSGPQRTAQRHMSGPLHTAARVNPFGPAVNQSSVNRSSLQPPQSVQPQPVLSLQPEPAQPLQPELAQSLPRPQPAQPFHEEPALPSFQPAEPLERPRPSLKRPLSGNVPSFTQVHRSKPAAQEDSLPESLLNFDGLDDPHFSQEIINDLDCSFPEPPEPALPVAGAAAFAAAPAASCLPDSDSSLDLCSEPNSNPNSNPNSGPASTASSPLRPLSAQRALVELSQIRTRFPASKTGRNTTLIEPEISSDEPMITDVKVHRKGPNTNVTIPDNCPEEGPWSKEAYFLMGWRPPVLKQEH